MPFLSQPRGLVVFRQRSFTRLWTADLISMIGDWALDVALPFFVYRSTGSTLATGLTFLAEFAPRVAFGSLAGVLVDRWDRLHTLTRVYIVQVMGLLPLIILVATPLRLWVVYPVLVFESLLDQFIGPAFQSSVPLTVPADELSPANSALGVSNNLARLAGPALGGTLLSVFGVQVVLQVDVVSFLVAALLVRRIRTTSRADEGSREFGRVPRVHMQLSRDWLSGITFVLRDWRVAAILLVVGIAQLGDGVLSVVLVPFVSHVLKGTGQVMGWILTSRGVGGLIGGVMLVHGGWNIRAPRVAGWAYLVIGLLMTAFAAGRSLPLELFLVGLVGVPAVVAGATVDTLLQSYAPDKYRGRVFGAYSTLLAILGLVGIMFSTLVADRIGIVPTLYISAFLTVLAGVIGLISSRRLLGRPATSATR